MAHGPFTPNCYVGDWVYDLQSGRTGLVTDFTSRRALVQFGPSGPFKRVWWGSLRPASPQEIAEKTGGTRCE